MSSYTSSNIKKEFILRTRKILKQYENQKDALWNEFYDITLLLNCLLGLVVLPRESELNNLPSIPIPAQISNILISSFDENWDKIAVDFNEFIVWLRNGIVHRWQNESLYFIDENDKISWIKIVWKTKREKHILTYKFNLLEWNDLKKVIDEILSYCYND